MSANLGRAVFRGYGYTRTTFLAAFGTTVYENGEIIWTDDGYISRADGSTQYQNLKYWRLNPANGNVTFYTSSGDLTIINESATAGIVTSVLKNSVRQINMQLSASGSYAFVDQTASRNIFTYNNAGYILFGTAFAYDSNCRLTVTTGTYNSLSLSDVAMMILAAGGGNIVLNGFSNGTENRKVSFLATTGPNTVTINHNNASGTQKILNNGSAAKTISDVAAGDFHYASSFWYSTYK